MTTIFDAGEIYSRGLSRNETLVELERLVFVLLEDQVWHLRSRKKYAPVAKLPVR